MSTQSVNILINAEPNAVLSVWGAVHSGVGSVLGGLEKEMPIGTFFGPQLVEAVHNGSVPSSRLDDMATRIIATW